MQLHAFFFSANMKNIFFLLLFFTPAVLAQNKVSFDVEVKQVNKGKSVTVRKEIYLNTNGNMVVRFIHPNEYYVITNTFGEARVYHPKTNEVMLINDKFLSSESESIYYFITNRIDDLGLRSLGFTLVSTRVEGNVIIRTYTPNKSNSNLSKVEIVHENHLPIYCAYYDTRNRMIEKLYYSDYQKLSFAAFPKRITGISYPTANDSIISRTLFTNVKSGKDAISSYFNFAIPANAKRVESSSLFQQPNKR
jgi:hypothetical protein